MKTTTNPSRSPHSLTLLSRSADGQNAPSCRRLRISRLVKAAFVGCLVWIPTTTGAADKGELVFTTLPLARYHVEGPIGQRLQVNTAHWLLRAPEANPGLIQMFYQRDRQPAPNLVPWAGEFIGKYLISAVQALRLAEEPELRARVGDLVQQLIASQAPDGYLGPFPEKIRLKAHWDLWGHYHCLLALLMWHEATGDIGALTASQRAADLICQTYLNTKQRVFDAGSHEMNMAIVHGLGWLYRITREGRYLQMMREIEKDWERAGDYFRTGLVGTEFFLTPRPRWESLHDLQGLVELFRITGDERYKTAFLHHWRSILRWDRRNTGGFSSGEQATGNPYAPTAIETCCTVAWMALTLDALQLTGDPLAADELELSTFNAAAGAQHPSGCWWTYNTPMDGTREASAHSIVFQARAGTPELNCCSVNGPRALGMLSEWAVMRSADGLAVNYYGPGSFQGKLADNTPVALQIETDYPLAGRVQIRVQPLAARRFTLKLRIPAWSHNTAVRLNNAAIPNGVPGRYLDLTRVWNPGDRITLDLELSWRVAAGDREASGFASVYRGPLLMAYDQKHNDFDEDKIPTIDLRRLESAEETGGWKKGNPPRLGPWLVTELTASDGRRVRLCDFASAGMTGTRYRSWLRVEPPPPPPARPREPADRATIPAGPALFRWTAAKVTADRPVRYQFLIATTDDFADPIVDLRDLTSSRAILDREVALPLKAGSTYYWKIVSRNESGVTDSARPLTRFSVDPSLPPLAPERLTATNSSALLVADALAGRPMPQAGRLVSAKGYAAASGPAGLAERAVQTDGKSGLITYQIAEFPDEDFAATLWVKFGEMPTNRLGQILSAWAGPMDDPLRLCVDQGKLYLRIEAGGGYSTEGLRVQPNRWYHLAAVKQGTDLSLYVDGEVRGRATVPLFVHSSTREIALGGNPRYPGNEFLAAHFSNLSIYPRALAPAEIKSLLEK